MRVTKTRDKTTKLINFKCRGSKIILHPLIVKLVTAGKTMLKKEYGFGEVFDVFNELGIIRNKLHKYSPRTLNKITVKNQMLVFFGLSMAGTNCPHQCYGSLQWITDWTGWSWRLADSVVVFQPNILCYTPLIFRIVLIWCISHIHLGVMPRLHHILLKLAEVQSLPGGTQPIRLGRTCQG